MFFHDKFPQTKCKNLSLVTLEYLNRIFFDWRQFQPSKFCLRD